MFEPGSSSTISVLASIARALTMRWQTLSGSIVSIAELLAGPAPPPGAARPFVLRPT